MTPKDIERHKKNLRNVMFGEDRTENEETLAEALLGVLEWIKKLTD